MYEITRNVLAEVKKAIVGKDDVISKVWIALLAEGHVLLEDAAELVPYVFGHRLMLSSRAKLNDYTPQAILAQVLEETPAPAMTERTL